MSNIDELRSRYLALNGPRPASTSLLIEIETTLGVQLPTEFRRICDFFDGSGLNVVSLFSLAGNAPKLNPLQETLRFRTAIGLPSNWLALGEPPESLIVMDCSNAGKVLWLDAIDAGRISSQGFARQPDSWASFADFFAFLLDEEEADRG